MRIQTDRKLSYKHYESFKNFFSARKHSWIPVIVFCPAGYFMTVLLTARSLSLLLRFAIDYCMICTQSRNYDDVTKACLFWSHICRTSFWTLMWVLKLNLRHGANNLNVGRTLKKSARRLNLSMRHDGLGWDERLNLFLLFFVTNHHWKSC